MKVKVSLRGNEPCRGRRWAATCSTRRSARCSASARTRVATTRKAWRIPGSYPTFSSGPPRRRGRAAGSRRSSGLRLPRRSCATASRTSPSRGSPRSVDASGGDGSVRIPPRRRSGGRCCSRCNPRRSWRRRLSSPGWLGKFAAAAAPGTTTRISTTRARSISTPAPVRSSPCSSAGARVGPATRSTRRRLGNAS